MTFVTDIVIENTGFNVTYWSQFSKQEFREECIRNHLFEDFSPNDRWELIELSYKIIHSQPV